VTLKVDAMFVFVILNRFLMISRKCWASQRKLQVSIKK